MTQGRERGQKREIVEGRRYIDLYDTYDVCVCDESCVFVSTYFFRALHNGVCDVCVLYE